MGRWRFKIEERISRTSLVLVHVLPNETDWDRLAVMIIAIAE